MSSTFTRSFSNSRSGANLSETILSVDAVRRRGIKRLFSLPVPGDARGVEAQPLIVENVTIKDGTTHTLCLLASMANNMLAYDADTGELLWATRLGNPIQGSKAIDVYTVNEKWGILSTPVISGGVAYAVAWSSPDGTVANAHFDLVAVNLGDGSFLKTLSLEGVKYDPGHGLPIQTFASVARKQRAGLLVTNGNGVKTIFIGCGSISESAHTNRGWVIAVDVASFTVSAAWSSTARYSGGGIWQGAQGLAADKAGYIYAVTGNGSFDGITDFGECAVKLIYTPPRDSPQAKLQCVDWFSPFSDAGRIGEDPTHTHIYAKGSGEDDATNMNAYDDQDLGSGGPLVIDELGLMLFAGKDGIAYVCHLANLGKNLPADFADIGKVKAKLAVPPVWFTFYPGPLDPMPQDQTKNNVQWFNRTHHQHSTPVYYNSPQHGPMVFTMGENGNLRAWGLDGARLRYLACSEEYASWQAPVPYGGMPGGMLTLSANGQANGSAIVWVLMPALDANKVISPGRLLAYDAQNFGTYPDGSRKMLKLWDSADWGINFTHNKFNVPVPINGKVYVPTYSGTVDVYGLA